jgi:hypothetical protein
MFLQEIYILVLKQFAHLQHLFISVFDALFIVSPLEFLMPNAFSNSSFVRYASDEIWILGKNNFDSFRFRGISFFCR